MATSYNGWQASRYPDAIDIDKAFTAAGRKFPGGVKRGPVSVVLRYVIEQFNARVEPVDLYAAGDEWGWHYKPSANSPSLLSCHSSGTAVDINATRHPNGKRGTFTPTQVDVIHDILREVDGVVRWLGDARTPDEMHFEIKGNAVEVARVAGRLLQPIPDEPPEVDVPAPATIAVGSHRWVFARGTNGALYGKHWNGQAWIEWKDYGGRLTSGPSAAVRSDGLVDVVARGEDAATWIVTLNPETGVIVTGWASLGGRS